MLFLCRICIISILRFGSPNKCPQRKEQRKKFIPFQFCGVFGAYYNSCRRHSSAIHFSICVLLYIFLYLVLVVATFLMCKENRLREKFIHKGNSNIKERSNLHFTFTNLYVWSIFPSLDCFVVGSVMLWKM